MTENARAAATKLPVHLPPSMVEFHWNCTGLHWKITKKNSPSVHTDTATMLILTIFEYRRSTMIRNINKAMLSLTKAMQAMYTIVDRA